MWTDEEEVGWVARDVFLRLIMNNPYIYIYILPHGGCMHKPMHVLMIAHFDCIYTCPLDDLYKNSY